MSCLKCKYQGVIIDAFRNWCHHPTYSEGTIVLTRTECDEWKKSSKKKPLEKPKPKRAPRRWPTSLRKGKPSCELKGYLVKSMANRRLRAFSDKYFRGE